MFVPNVSTYSGVHRTSVCSSTTSTFITSNSHGHDHTDSRWRTFICKTYALSVLCCDSLCCAVLCCVVLCCTTINAVICRQSDDGHELAMDTFDQSLGRDHRQTIAAVSRLSAYMGRTGKGINHIFKGAKSEVRSARQREKEVFY